MRVEIELTVDQCSKNFLMLYEAWKILDRYPGVKMTVVLEGESSVVSTINEMLRSRRLDAKIVHLDDEPVRGKALPVPSVYPTSGDH